MAQCQGVLIFHNGAVADDWQDNDSGPTPDFSWFNFSLNGNQCPNSANCLDLTRRLTSQKLAECSRGENVHPLMSIAVRVSEVVGLNRTISAIEIESGGDAIMREVYTRLWANQSIILPVKFVIDLNQRHNSMVKPSHDKLHQKFIYGLYVFKFSGSHHPFDRNSFREGFGTLTFHDSGQDRNRGIKVYLCLYPVYPIRETVGHCLLCRRWSHSHCFESNTGNDEAAFQQHYLVCSTYIDECSCRGRFVCHAVSSSDDPFGINDEHRCRGKAFDRIQKDKWQYVVPTF